MNEKAWQLLFLNYNGGPEICLSSNEDIYLGFESCTDRDYSPYFVFTEGDASEREMSESSEIVDDLNKGSNFPLYSGGNVSSVDRIDLKK